MMFNQVWGLVMSLNVTCNLGYMELKWLSNIVLITFVGFFLWRKKRMENTKTKTGKLELFDNWNK